MADVIPISRDAVRSRRKREVRSRTESMNRMPKRRLELVRELANAAWPEGVERPRTRADCAGIPRPCPFVGCVHNLYLDVSDRTGSIQHNFPDLEPERRPADRSCALDVIDSLGSVTLEGVGELMNVTRERVRQIELKALKRITLRMRPLADDPNATISFHEMRGAVGVSLRGASHLDEPATPAADPGELEDVEDERSTMLLRGLNPRERDEAERFARVAATLVLAGWRPLEAWDRANELLDQVEPGDPMPFDAFPEVASTRAASPPFVTPAERLVEPPKNVEHMLPRERRVLVEDFEQIEVEPDSPVPDAEPIRGAGEASRIARPRRLVPRAGRTGGSIPPMGAASASSLTKERVMGTEKEETIELKAKLLSELRAKGAMGLGAIVEAVGEDEMKVRHALRALKDEKQVVSEGWARAATWAVREGKASAPAKRRVVRRDPKPRKEANGHRVPSAGLEAGFTANLIEMRAYHQKKIDAIDALLEGG